MRRRIILGLALAAACGKSAPSADQVPEAAAGAAIEKTVDQGPLSATVSLSPDKPTLGDVLRLTLTVTADAGTQVTMPPFGEALGRFEVVSFKERQESADGGKRRLIQDYRLQASRSGRLRVPPLRVEYVAAGGTAPEELLTEELPLDIASVLTAEGTGTLPAPRGALDEAIARPWLIPALVGAGALVGVIAALVLLARARRARVAAIRRDAGQVALGRLAALDARGVPADRDAADPWYVELSDIVRRYLEDRYGVRAPELTTEEFLREARAAAGLDGAQQALLGVFLVGCDRVKFAGHAPSAAESAEALEAARRFVRESAAPIAPATEAAR